MKKFLSGDVSMKLDDYDLLVSRLIQLEELVRYRLGLDPDSPVDVIDSFLTLELDRAKRIEDALTVKKNYDESQIDVRLELGDIMDIVEKKLAKEIPDIDQYDVRHVGNLYNYGTTVADRKKVAKTLDELAWDDPAAHVEPEEV